MQALGVMGGYGKAWMPMELQWVVHCGHLLLCLRLQLLVLLRDPLGAFASQFIPLVRGGLERIDQACLAHASGVLFQETAGGTEAREAFGCSSPSLPSWSLGGRAGLSIRTPLWVSEGFCLQDGAMARSGLMSC